MYCCPLYNSPAFRKHKGREMKFHIIGFQNAVKGIVWQKESNGGISSEAINSESAVFLRL